MTDALAGVVAFEAARSGSFTLAGERLGITKSAVGKSVTRLESRLGTRLLHRSTRKLTLTTDGEVYLAGCSAALDSIAEAEAVIGGDAACPSGRLKIDMPAAFGRARLLPIFTELTITNPGLHFTMSFSDCVSDPIEEGVDLVIRFGPTKDSAGLISRKLTDQRQYICASPAYLARNGVPRTLADLENHSCIVGYRRGTPLQWTVRDGSIVTAISPPPTHQIGDGDAIVAMAVAGGGLCQMPASLVRSHLESGELVALLDENEGPPISIHAVWPGTRHLSPRLRHVVDALTAKAKSGLLD